MANPRLNHHANMKALCCFNLPMTMTVKQYCVVSHTHWDREWYLPFEQFRLRLVALIDNVLEIERQNESTIQQVNIEDYIANVDRYLGCSPRDTCTGEMRNADDTVLLQGAGFIAQGLRHLAARTTKINLSTDDTLLTVVNTLQHNRDTVITASVIFPESENIKSFTLWPPSSVEVPCELLSRRSARVITV